MLKVKTRLGTSGIHGIGLFADQPIPAGAVVWCCDGFDQVLPEAYRDEFLTHYGYRRRTGQWVLPADNGRFSNHSETPNTGPADVAGLVDAEIALRDIAEGEELTIDYRTICTDWKSQ
jgi:SET domain-containing protein